MTSKLQAFLNKYPWEKHKLKNQKPLEFIWEFELEVSAKELWPHLIETSKFNQALGLPKMNFEESTVVYMVQLQTQGFVRLGSKISGNGLRRNQLWEGELTVKASADTFESYMTYRSLVKLKGHV